MDLYPCDENYPAECSLLIKASLEKQRQTKKQMDSPAGSETDRLHWVSAKDFTVEVGKEQIEAYIQTWEIQSSWSHSLDFLFITEEEHTTFYHYRARFSNVTAQKPIQGTASVYFVVEVSKNTPQTLPVEVHFVMESNRLVHTPGKTRFTEKWLADIIESKALLRRTVNL
ncbi:A-kinase anchor protein 14 [Melanotaenia boesemani]|uniref:A-kinase anchor protein 14 n=1 Tax=Melanotaenia boesemani TaxID=1250792 RepID=UPI001C03A3A6|nr:A-kinase anchor protein 14 [Melanotaenia boesemani]